MSTVNTAQPAPFSEREKAMLRTLEAIAHNGKLDGMVGFREWATKAAEFAVRAARTTGASRE